MNSSPSPSRRRLRAKARYQLRELAEFLSALAYGRTQGQSAVELPESRLPTWLQSRLSDPPARRAWAIASSPRLASADTAQLLLDEAVRLVDLFPVTALTHASLALSIAARAAAQRHSSRTSFALGANAAIVIAEALLLLGDQEESLLALAVAETASAVALRSPVLTGKRLLIQARGAVGLGRLGPAQEQLERATASLGEARDWALAGKALLVLGWLFFQRQELGAVAYLITSGAAYLSPLSAPEQKGRPFLLLAWAAARAGSWQAARGLLEEAARLCDGLFPCAEQPRFAWLTALVAAEANQAATAKQRLEAVAAELLAGRRYADLAEIARDLAHLYGRLGDAASARTWRVRSALSERARRRQATRLEAFWASLQGEDFWRTWTHRGAGEGLRSALARVSGDLSARAT